MKIPPLRSRKLHLALFALALFIQAAVFYLALRQTPSSVTETRLFHENNALAVSNRALQHYFQAENAFLEYLNEFDPATLERFDKSIDSLKFNLNELEGLTRSDQRFGNMIESKRSTSGHIARMTHQLDSLLQIRASRGEIQWQPRDFEMQAYNFEKVLSSVTFDSIRFSETALRKNILKRLGDAIRGKHDIKREELRVFMTMEYQSGPKKGSFEDQMRNLYKETQTFYNGEFQRLRSTYSNLRGKDQEMLATNRLILKKAQELLNVYLKTAQQTETVQLAKTMSQDRNNRLYLALLLQGLVLVTVALMIYTWWRFKYEDRLIEGKRRAEESLQFKRRILGMLSHEMRAPLRIMSTLSAQMLEENRNPEMQKNLGLMHFTSKSLQITAGQILEFFKKQQSSLTAFNGRVILKQELSDILDSLTLLAENKKLELRTDLAKNLSQPVWADNGKIHQLFYNIIGNAIKFTEKGHISVSANLLENEGKFKLEVTISDTGAGIPKEDIRHIFDQFYQSGHHSGQISFGAGLGLNLCKEIIDLYQGEISVESELGKGTAISFYLMLEKAEDPQNELRHKIIEITQDQPLRVAAFDDDPIALRIISKIGSEIKASTTTALTFTDCMMLAETGKFDVAVVDMNISGVSGSEIIKKIRDHKNPNQDCIIMAITGDNYADFEDVKQTGADALLIKPINKEELFSRLLALLQERTVGHA